MPFFKFPDLCGFILALAGSYYGHFRGKITIQTNFKRARHSHEWLKNKRILIIGTGPSATALSKPLIKDYDYLVFLNLAIKFSPTILHYGISPQSVGFFTADRHRILQVKSWLRLVNIQRNNCIYLPDYPQSMIFFDINKIHALPLTGFKKFRKAFVSNSNKNCKGGWHMLYTETPINSENLKSDYDKYMKSNEFPALCPYSSVFSAIMFYSLFRPIKIDLIGCDFTGEFTVEPMQETFELVSNLLSSYGIQLSNKSSRFTE